MTTTSVTPGATDRAGQDGSLPVVTDLTRHLPFADDSTSLQVGPDRRARCNRTMELEL